eukprot:7215777-Ditylum_brightwellii.AAC.2
MSKRNDIDVLDLVLTGLGAPPTVSGPPHESPDNVSMQSYLDAHTQVSYRGSGAGSGDGNGGGRGEVQPS